MRLFTGIDLPEEVGQNLEELLTKLRPAARLKWSRVRNLHITTKFIGEWPEDRLKELSAALAEVPKRESIPISVSGLGWFPNPHSPRVFWAGIQAPPQLAELAHDTDQRLGRLGIALEDRPFHPHLTLARIRPPADLLELKKAVAALPSVEFGSFTVDRFYLYLSQRGPTGSEYHHLAGFSIREK
jgi:2'-5' RNA ligase